MALTAKKVYAILKHQIKDMEAKLNHPVRYRGTVASAELLPLNPDIGDMYNIESKSIYGEAGMNVAWNGVVWDTMGAPIDMSLYLKSTDMPEWSKQPNKPAYTAEEVGALPADTKIPSNTSDLNNDSGFLTGVPDTYLTKEDAKKEYQPVGDYPTKEEVKGGYQPKGDYVTKSTADETYQPAGNYLTENKAKETYQPVGNYSTKEETEKKLNKNQGIDNAGKIAGINENGDIVPVFPTGVQYNEETNLLEFGTDSNMLNKGIQLDATLKKSGYAADSAAVGENIDSLKEDLDSFYEEIYSYGTPVFKHIHGDGSIYDNNNKNIAFATPVFAIKGSTITVDDGYKYQVALYDKTTGTFIKRIEWKYYGDVYTLDDDYLVRIEISDYAENILSDMSIFSHLKYQLIAGITQKVENVRNEVENVRDVSINTMNNIVNMLGTDNFKQKINEVVAPKKYNAWSFISALNDKLVLLYSKGNFHEDSNGFDVYARTSQNGIIWTDEKLIFGYKNERENITGKGVDYNGDVIVWLRVGNPAGINTKHELFKTNDGVKFEKISSPIFPVVCGHIGDIVKIPDTQTLIAFFNTYSATRSWGIVKSIDNGVTWTQLVVEQNLSASECPTEISGTYIGNDKIIAIGRKDAIGGTSALFQLQSKDNGDNWSKQYTNITDMALSTPSIINDNGNLSLYYFHRGYGKLRLRKNNISDVWDNPTNWNNSEVIASGTGNMEDEGNVNACTFKNCQIATYYAGDSSNTGIYTIIV